MRVGGERSLRGPVSRARRQASKAVSDTASLTGGGLKGADLPSDYREFIFDTFNLATNASTSCSRCKSSIRRSRSVVPAGIT